MVLPRRIASISALFQAFRAGRFLLTAQRWRRLGLGGDNSLFHVLNDRRGDSRGKPGSSR